MDSLPDDHTALPQESDHTRRSARVRSAGPVYTLLQGGTIVDGTGGAPYAGDVLIADNRMVEVGRVQPPDGCVRLDCRELTVVPGFIDIHSHSDLQVLEDRREKVAQGVTAEVVGNCGFSPYPAGDDRRALHSVIGALLLGCGEWGWQSAAEYLADVGRLATLVHVRSLVGHGTLRLAVAGTSQAPLRQAASERLASLVQESLTAGACGLSTGLMYAPGSAADVEELLPLCEIVAKHDAIYTTHMRSYASGLAESVDEQLELARRTGCRLQISHLQTVGAANWDKQQRVLERIDQARRDGVDVMFDAYPYLAGSTTITQLVPQRVLEGGVALLLGRLARAAERRALAAEMREEIPQRWSDIFITSVGSASDEDLVGKSLEHIARVRKCEPVDALIDIIVRTQGAATIVAFNQSEQNLKQILTHPLCVVMSDGLYVSGRPHPRLYGSFPTLLGDICRERRWLTLPEAVHKITQMPAQRFGLSRRGLIAPGAVADLVVFDPDTVGSRATYEAPERPPDGISMVFHEGRPTVPLPLHSAV